MIPMQMLENARGLSSEEIRGAMQTALGALTGIRRALVVPPDITRIHGRGGELAAIAYDILCDAGAEVDVLPALGTHMPMTREEQLHMYGARIPESRVFVHDWRAGVDTLGQVPGEFVREVSEGLLDYGIAVQLSRHITRGNYDLVLCTGQVVPHEVAGFSGHAKHLYVGCGGSEMINGTHYLGAVYGVERVLGTDHSPVRRVLDYADEHYASRFPILHAMTVIGVHEGKNVMKGLYLGSGRAPYDRAVALAGRENIIRLPKPARKIVAYLEPGEYRTTWLGNKSVYRTRMAIESGGELLVLAPGVVKFGEDAANDGLIRKYGYCGRVKVLELAKSMPDLAANLSVAAHLMHGSSEGRFTITYAVNHLTPEQVEGVCYRYMRYEDAVRRYDPQKLAPGENTMPDGEQVYFIPNPGLGLWGA